MGSDHAPNTRSTTSRFALCVGAIVAFAGAAFTQGVQPESALAARDLTPIIRALDSDSLEVRERAVEQLGSNPVVTLREVLGLLRDVSALSPEQRARLIDLARAMFKDSPRAAMGIQFGGTVESGVAIASLIEGFDAFRQLKPGDVIEAANGEPLSQNRLRSVIVSHDPGESMTLSVRRIDAEGKSESLDVRIVLGSFNRLRGGGFIDSQTLDEAWRARMARSGIVGPSADAPIVSGVDREAWLNSAQAVARWIDSTDGPGTARAPRTGIAGEPRSEWTEPESDLFAMYDGDLRNGRMAGINAERMVILDELRVLQLQTEALRTGQRANLATLQNPTLAAQERTRILADNERIGRELLPLEQRMSELRAQLNRRH